MNPMKLEAIMAMWENDCKVDETEPGKEILKVPNLHAKYSRQLTMHSLTLKSHNINLALLKKVKYEYYSGKMSQEDLDQRGWEPFRFVLKSDISVYVDGDPEMMTLKSKIAIHEEAVNYCAMIMKEISARTWELKAFMEWRKFTSDGQS